MSPRKVSLMGGIFQIESKNWVIPLIITSLICVVLFATSFNMGLVSSGANVNSLIALFPSRYSRNDTNTQFAEEKLKLCPPPPPLRPSIPRFAYLVSGSRGDLDKLWRTLRALYHPRNQYVVHLDLESPVEERFELASRLENDTVFASVGNVYMITKANMVTYRGPTMVANTLHACAILMKRSKDWDWFINLSASDYPLVTQDDLLYTFRDLDRNLNFIEHTGNLGWKADFRGRPVMVDPGLYETKKQDILWVGPRRALPTAFKLYTGSAWMILARPFVEYLIEGWDNLPRVLLMYYTNFVSSPEGYFHTVICNAPEFIPTAVNHDMHYISWDNPPKQHPHSLSLNDSAKMVASQAPFARKFKYNNPVLDKIDRELLGRRKGGFTPGAWCAGKPRCARVGDSNVIKPGPGSKRLGKLVSRLVKAAKSKKNQCV